MLNATDTNPINKLLGGSFGGYEREFLVVYIFTQNGITNKQKILNRDLLTIGSHWKTYDIVQYCLNEKQMFTIWKEKNHMNLFKRWVEKKYINRFL